MLKRFIYYFFLLIVLHSCKNVIENQKPLYFKLDENKVKIDSIPIASSMQIQLVGNHIILHNIYSEDYFLHLFLFDHHKNNATYKNAIAPHGGSSNEISSSGFAYSDLNKIWLDDTGKQRVLGYSIKEISKNKDSLASTIITYPKEVGMLMFYVIDDQKIVSQSYDNPNYMLSHIEEDSIYFTTPHFINDEPIHNADFFKMYKFFLGKHPSQSKYVTAYAYYDDIRIINQSGEIEHRYQGEMDISFTDTKHDLATYRGYIRTSENYIYFPFIGKEVLNKQEMRINLPMQLHVFDWELNKRAILDLGSEFTSFDIDEEKRIIIAVLDNENQSIVKFNLPDELFEE